MDDKRRHKRFTVEGIHGNMLFISDIHIINISLGGAAIETSRRLRIGTEYTIKLDDKGRSISFKGLVVWAVLKEGKKSAHGEVIPVYRAGIEFRTIVSEKLEELVTFIDGHKKADEGRLKGLRFKIHGPERAVLDYIYSYTVKKLSLGGMLIESSDEFKLDETYSMEIFLPHDKAIRFSGRIAHCQLAEGLPIHYDIGIEFTELKEEDKSSLEEFIKSI
ncbi:MAG: PilZ domain-containing protein [Nitrospirae bacterium]|nr:PilZ domain-containing protein [Nitrospirota bacterium]